MDELAERLNKAVRYLVWKGYVSIQSTQKDIAEKMGTTTSNVSAALKGSERFLTDGFLFRFNDAFKGAFSENWILNGEGEINDEILSIPASSGTAITTEEEYNDAIGKGLKLLPQVSFKFAAGQTQLINTTEDITRYWYLPDCKDCEGVAQVVGRSMSPTLPSGCWVALKRYTLPKDNPNTIPFGNIFGIVVEDEDTGEYHGHIKVLRRYKDQIASRKYWIAHSINSDEFDDYDIEICQVRSLWIVKQHIVSDILL
ncbi:S24 family peptidase [Parabacteroides distasonis]|uniref:S24 family peptidase n=1 Tax=Parabacteroides distasonis TaxID=823 RepID=UPI003565558A